MVEEKKGLHRAYAVFVGVCLLNAGAMGLVLNVVGNFFMPISKATGVAIPSVVLMMTVYSIVMLVWLPFAGRLFDKVDGRLLFGIAGIAITISLVLNSFWTNIYGFYASACIWGLCGPILFLVGPSTLINNWFAPHKAGRFLGIASAFTGVGAFVWSPMIAGIIKASGYNTAFLVEAALAFVLIVPVSLILFRVHPEDMGLKPCGSDETEAVAAFEAKNAAAAKGGMAPKIALGTLAFYAVFIAACLISLGGGFKSTMPVFAATTGIADAAMVGATMISAGALGNIIGKILLGFLSDKLGLIPTITFFAVLVMVGYVTFIMFGGNRGPMLFGGFCIGCADAMMSVGLPLVTRTVFGLKNYAKIYSYLNMGIAILGGFGAVIITGIAGAKGWPTAYVIGVVAYAVVAVSLLYALLSAKKLKAKWDQD
ncbi:MAG: MFS transporter [Actinobacteria bacterium]|nr:MFS transporter [Actinomycetota bacterium]